MPIFTHQHIAPQGEAALWRIEEPEAWFLRQLELSPAEQAQLSRLKGRRRVEWLAARQLVHHMSGRRRRAAFLKDEFGKPRLEGSSYHISVSHSHGMAAAIAAPVPAGIDIQQLVPKIERIAHKFMRPEEMDSLQPGSRLEHLHVYWGAKEALYKAYGRRALDFRAHIYITPFVFSFDGGSFTGTIQKERYQAYFRLYYALLEDYIMVYALQETEA